MGLSIDDPSIYMKRIGIVRISFDLLEDVLGVQKDHHIVGVISNVIDTHNRVVKLIIKGPLMPLQYDEGEDIVIVRYEDIKDVIRKGELK